MSAGIPDQVRCPERLQAVRQAQLIGEAPAPGIIRLVELAATLMDAPLAFFTVVDDERSWYHAAVGIPEDLDSGAVEGSFCKYVIASTEPLVVGDAAADVRTIGNPAIASMGVRAWAGHPVRDPDGHILGSFCVVDTSPRDWTDRDVELLAVLAAAADDEVANHRMRMAEIDARARFEESRTELDVLRASQYEVLELLQRSLLPTSVPPVAGLEIAVRYESASHASGLGGDWYDVVELADSRVALVIADVAGHDAQAVATMAQLRPSLHAFARDVLRPSEVLGRLHRLMVELGASRFLTAFYGTWDPTSASLRFQSAGHPPLILARSGGRAGVCEAGRAGLLGSPALEPGTEEHEIVLDQDDVFAVFTDGLFERHDRSFDDGLDGLLGIIDEHHGESVESIADALMREARSSDGWDDDVALLVARARPTAGT